MPKSNTRRRPRLESLEGRLAPTTLVIALTPALVPPAATASTGAAAVLTCGIRSGDTLFLPIDPDSGMGPPDPVGGWGGGLAPSGRFQLADPIPDPWLD